MPQLQALWSEVSKERDDVVFLCVNYTDEVSVIQEYWKKEKFDLQAVKQKGSVVSDAFGVIAYPTNYLIGPDGKIAWRAVGYDEAAIREFLKM